jgi:phage tail P2-like protein
MVETSLLPRRNATPWELVQSNTDAARWPLPVHLVKDVWNPATCPLDLLPYLAAGLGLEIWHDDWNEAKKRAIVADIWQLKRNKTKLKGLIEYAALEGAGVVKAVRPRDKVFAVDPWSASERAAIEAEMPQIHIFPAAPDFAAEEGMAFLGDTAFGYNFALAPSDASLRFSERGIFVDGTVSMRCTVTGLQGIASVSTVIALATPTSVARFFLDKALETGALFDNDANMRVITITPDQSALSFAVPSGVVPSTVRPLPKADDVPAPCDMAFGYRFALGFLSTLYPDDAAAHSYDSLTLFDATRIKDPGAAVSFWGWSSFGCEPFTAELTLDILLAGVAWPFPGPLGLAATVEPDLSPFWDSLSALRVAQAERDTVYVSTLLYEPITFNGGFLFGQFNFGDLRKVA